MSIYLPKWESYFLLSCYIFVIVIGIKNVLSVCTPDIPGYIYFEDGWIFLGRRRDNSDYEWESWSSFAKQTFHWYCFYIILMEVLRLTRIKKFSLVSFAFGATFLLVTLGAIPVTIFFVKTLLFYCIVRYKRKFLIWLMVIFWMLLNNFSQIEDIFYHTFKIDEQRVYFLYVALGWNTLKCVSFTIDKIEDDNKGLFYGFLDYLGYIFYAPTLFFGPVHIFQRHRQMLLNYNDENLPSTFQKLKSLSINLLRCYLIFIFTQFSLHFLYVNNFQYYHKQILPKLSAFGLYEYGYLMGQIFHHKYSIFYGYSIALGIFDNISMPNRPKCISRINRYSDMWKYFDQGLYEFLFKYIYAQLCHKKSCNLRKFSAAFVTFVFIYVWHGLWWSIFIWSMLNFVCVILENVLTTLQESQKYKEIMGKYLGTNNLLRFNAMIATNVMIPSILSNFIFFAGTDVGLVFFRKTYTSGIPFYLKLLVICYSLYTTNEWIRRWEKQKLKLVKEAKE